MKKLTEAEFQNLVVELADHLAAHVPRGQDIKFAIFLWREYVPGDQEFAIGGTVDNIDGFVDMVERWVGLMRKGEVDLTVKDTRTGVKGTREWRKAKKGD